MNGSGVFIQPDVWSGYSYKYLSSLGTWIVPERTYKFLRGDGTWQYITNNKNNNIRVSGVSISCNTFSRNSLGYYQKYGTVSLTFTNESNEYFHWPTSIATGRCYIGFINTIEKLGSSTNSTTGDWTYSIAYNSDLKYYAITASSTGYTSCVLDTTYRQTYYLSGYIPPSSSTTITLSLPNVDNNYWYNNYSYNEVFGIGFWIYGTNSTTYMKDIGMVMYPYVMNKAARYNTVIYYRTGTGSGYQYYLEGPSLV